MTQLSHPLPQALDSSVRWPVRAARVELTVAAAGAALILIRLAEEEQWPALHSSRHSGAAYAFALPSVRAAIAFTAGSLAGFGAAVACLDVSWNGFAIRELPRWRSRRRVSLCSRPHGRALVEAPRHGLAAGGPLGRHRPRNGRGPLPLRHLHRSRDLGHRQATRCRSPVGGAPPERRADRARRRSARGVVCPRANGAAVVLVHGGGGSRDGLKLHAEMLVAHGYGVLLYDERGRGASGGRSNAFGWDWSQDVETAVTYLERQGVHHVGVLGLSTGAEVALTAAAEDHRIAAVVADGTEARTLDDFAHQARPTSGRAFPTGPSRRSRFA